MTRPYIGAFEISFGRIEIIREISESKTAKHDPVQTKYTAVEVK